MGSYENIEQIDQDLRRLDLERQIAFEELKVVKYEYEEKLKPLNILGGALKLVGKYGFIMALKKMFR